MNESHESLRTKMVVRTNQLMVEAITNVAITIKMGRNRPTSVAITNADDCIQGSNADSVYQQ